MPMHLRFSIIPCRDLSEQQRFWCDALRGKPAGSDPHAMIEFPGAGGAYEEILLVPAPPQHVAGAVLFWFQPTEEPLVAEVRRLEEAGATLLEKRHHGWGIGEVTMADPEGNAFIVTSSLREEQEIPALLESAKWSDCDPFWVDAEVPYGRPEFRRVASILFQRDGK